MTIFEKEVFVGLCFGGGGGSRHGRDGIPIHVSERKRKTLRARDIPWSL
jgi:hypothetical protein